MTTKKFKVGQLVEFRLYLARDIVHRFNYQRPYDAIDVERHTFGIITEILSQMETWTEYELLPLNTKKETKQIQNQAYHWFSQTELKEFVLFHNEIGALDDDF